MPATPENILPDTVWLTHVNEACIDRLADLDEVLSPDERERAARFTRADARLLFIAARVHLRTALSRHVRLHPAEWRFQTEPGGRPVVANRIAPSLHFSLSHTRGLVATAVSHRGPCGVDVEYTGRRVHPLAVARHSFSAAETALLEDMEPGAQREHFFRLWTLKEAYSKATGRGLALGFNRFQFALSDVGVAAHFDPSLSDNPARWAFHSMQPSPAHQLGLALPANGAPAVQFQTLLL